MPLQNRVTPFGEIVARPARGLFMGNRGGRLHDPETRSLGRRRWTSKAWICCLTAFKERHRKVMGESYTELFFLDEVTAFSAGHRPCYECRRQEARAFAQSWADAAQLPAAPSAPDMDGVLHRERLHKRCKKMHRLPIETLPDGAVIIFARTPWAIHGDRLLRWNHSAYDTAAERPAGGEAHVLTPPSIVNVLRAGYMPVWHPSADAVLSDEPRLRA